MTGRWESIKAHVWETVVTPCTCCGQVVPRRLWMVEIDEEERAFCSPECEELYRTYVQPKLRRSHIGQAH